QLLVDLSCHARPPRMGNPRRTFPPGRTVNPVRVGLAIAAAAGAVLVAALVASGGTGRPTYNRDVAPILDSKCASCHRLGGIAPFALTTAAGAKAHATGIARMTSAGLMPPWMPGEDSAAMVGPDARRLTRGELATLGWWGANG